MDKKERGRNVQKRRLELLQITASAREKAKVKRMLRAKKRKEEQPQREVIRTEAKAVFVSGRERRARGREAWFAMRAASRHALVHNESPDPAVAARGPVVIEHDKQVEEE
jgi:hypothetical protein